MEPIEEIKKIVGKITKLEVKDNWIEVPPDKKFGDFSCTIAFDLAKEMKRNPNEIANEIVKKIKLGKESNFSKIEVISGYINFFLKKEEFCENLLNKILKEGKKFGRLNIGKRIRTMVEFSQPNTHKAFHIGHLRNTCLGDALSRILEFANFDVIRANYPGDIGMHVARCLWCYLKFHRGEEPKERKGEWLGKIYAEACKRIEENPAYEAEVKEILKKLEERDKKLINIWRKTRKWSLDDFKRIYKELDVKFDVYFFESELERKGKRIVEEALKKGIAKISEGAPIVDLSAYGLDVFMLLRSDGTSLYSTKDLALAKEKFEKYKIKKSIYVVGSEQKMYFQQLFKTLELLGFKQASDCYHLSYELVMFESGKMSSREGTVVLYDELADKMKEKAYEEVRKRNPKISEKEARKIAEIIAIGAMKYGMLKFDNNKVIIFDWEKMLEFEGDTGPYLQYACVRANKILEKYGEIENKIRCNQVEEVEIELIKQISIFPALIKKICETYKVNLLADYCYRLASKFNEFYDKCPVLSEKDEEKKRMRIAIVHATKLVIERCLLLLGIKIPEFM
ncbi:MAG: arginine--tRNA ligase [Candidatus Parvarchaeota archaeon]|nr:arginine--tRNA ligase [Candidatus Jingweiarchaeum tengchongense]MCW1310948.1 arginine--tRNA ligase [Candidatus Jingweiarchaeum tengchongense]